MAAGLCLSDNNALVDLCTRRPGGNGGCTTHGQLSGYSRSNGQSGKEFECGLILTKIRKINL